jgi:hypothetical protein
MPLLRLPRPASPRGALSDFVQFLRDEHPYKWALFALSVLCTGLIVAAFHFDTRDQMPTEPTIIYAENWRADRSDVEILEQLKKDVVVRAEQINQTAREYQKAADLFGIDYKDDVARAEAKRKAEDAHIQLMLDKRIEIARAQLAAKKAAAPPASTQEAKPQASRP